MTQNSTKTVLCLASYFKGIDFLRQAAALGWNVVLLTREKLKDEEWPHESVAGIFAVGDSSEANDYVKAAIRIAQNFNVTRVVALEEFDVITAGLIREYLALPGLTSSAARLFRDKLLMRIAADRAGIPVPLFINPRNPHAVSEFVENVEPPWVLKPRSDVSAIGIRKLANAGELWTRLDELDQRDDVREGPAGCVLEKYLPGDVFHVDSLVSGGKVQFALANGYERPPMDVAHGGGIFISRSLKRGSREERALQNINKKVIGALGLRDGVTHAEFIRAEADGKLHFLEIAARVGGAFLADTFEAATGLSLWREWAKIELSEHYDLPRTEPVCAGIALSLARQEFPDTSGYIDSEIAYRVNKPFHVGLIVRSSDHNRVAQLLQDYAGRFVEEFCAVAPPLERVE
jgi:biotin carboxylase